jgi:hypothetical protein
MDDERDRADALNLDVDHPSLCHWIRSFVSLGLS